MSNDHPENHIKPAAEQVRELLDLKKITQSELAEEMGVTQPTVSRWLSGKQEPNYLQTVKLMTINYDYLMRTIGEVQQHTAYISGDITSNLSIKGYEQRNYKIVRVNNFYKSTGQGGLIITEHAQSFPGLAGWILLFGWIEGPKISPGSYYLFNEEKLGPIVRQCTPGSRSGLLHLHAPNITPLFDSKAKPTHKVLALIPPSNEILEIPEPMTPHAISHVLGGN